MTKILVLKVRGAMQANYGVKETLAQLGLKRIHSCAVLEDNASVKGMLQKAKDYLTWGELDATTEKLLESKRKSREVGKHKVYALNSPKKGFKPVKRHVPKGELGHRKDIGKLIERMV
jgi:ribosomal protein L30/L7E